jgi:hypothetical protein
MEQKTKKGLIAVGATLGLLAVVYYIFRRPATTNITTYFGPLPTGQDYFDPYSQVDRVDKTKFVKNYLKNNYTGDVVLLDSIGQEPWWTFADSEAKGRGLNAWYEAIKKNQEKFTWKRLNALQQPYYVNTKTGQVIK